MLCRLVNLVGLPPCRTSRSSSTRRDQTVGACSTTNAESPQKRDGTLFLRSDETPRLRELVRPSPFEASCSELRREESTIDSEGWETSATNPCCRVNQIAPSDNQNFEKNDVRDSDKHEQTCEDLTFDQRKRLRSRWCDRVLKPVRRTLMHTHRVVLEGDREFCQSRSHT